jgi:hypothetical protein
LWNLDAWRAKAALRNHKFIRLRLRKFGATSDRRASLIIIMASLCFPTARKNSEASVASEVGFQCASCRISKTKTSVVVGGGLIGNSIALFLGRTRQREVIVLEARDRFLQGASRHNSGLISSHWFSDELRKLADHSFSIYKDLARRHDDFIKTCDYYENSLFKAQSGEGVSDGHAPRWMKAIDGWYLESEPSRPRIQEQTPGSGSLSDNPSSATMYVFA